jgi:hypothetical protein
MLNPSIVLSFPRGITTTSAQYEACKGHPHPSGLYWESLEMILQSPDADACRMSVSIARFNTCQTRDMRDKRPHAHAAWTEHFP